jgi:transposase
MLATEKIQIIDINIHQIRRDGGTQPRGLLDEDHINDLLVSLKSGAKLEEILVYYDGENYWLTDGYHRLAATIRYGKDKIRANIRQGTLEEAQWHSFSVNQHNVLKRSNADKQRAIIGALKHCYGYSKSNTDIARHCGVDEKTVRIWRSSLEESGEIQKSESREVFRNGTVYHRQVSDKKHSKTESQKFKVIATDIPEYYGEVVELVEIKSSDCYQCKTPDGKIYPFTKSELGDEGLDLLQIKMAMPLATTPDDIKSIINATPATQIIEASVRQRLIGIVLRLPDTHLKEAEEFLIEKFGGILAIDPIAS